MGLKKIIQLFENQTQKKISKLEQQGDYLKAAQ